MKKHNLIALPQRVDSSENLPAVRNGPAYVGSEGFTPTLSPALLEVLRSVQNELGLAQGSTGDLNKTSAELESMIQEEAQKLGFQLSSFERDQVLVQIERDGKQFGVLDELVNDPSITDVIVSSYNRVLVQQSRSNYSTGIKFPSQAAYEAFVERLLIKAGSSYSTKKPIADGMIEGFARLHAVHKCIAAHGPYLTIRLNRFASVSMRDLFDKGLAPREVLVYLENVIRSGNTLLIVGEVGTGKTTLARALSAALPIEESILVIEDTPEIKLEHPNVRYIVTRPANTEGEGRVAPSEVIRGGMRMAMNRIVFGEIRDPEAAEAFIDVCASGHPGLSTLHAKNAADAIVRLQLLLGRSQRGVDKEVLQQQIATAVGVVVYVDMCHETGGRRIFEVKELGNVSDGILKQKEIFRYEPAAGVPQWKLVNFVSNFKSELEKSANPLFLHEIPRTLELTTDVLFRQAQKQFI